MESTKIRALTQLCLELKQRRETLIEQWSSTQNYLDTKQHSLEHEFRALQQDNQMLFDHVAHLREALGEFHTDWKDYLQHMLQLQRELRQLGGEYQQLQQDFGVLHTEMRLIQQHLSQHTEADNEEKIAFEDLERRLQQQTQELQSTYEKYQNQQNVLEKMYQQKSLQNEQVDVVKTELSGLQGHFQQLGTDVKHIHAEIEAYKIRWQAEHEAQQNAFADLRTEHDTLSDQHQVLQEQHAVLEALQSQKEAEYSTSLARQEDYQTRVKALSQESSQALSALHDAYRSLQSDTHALLSALKTLQSRYLKDQKAHIALAASFDAQATQFAAQEEKFTDLEAQGALYLRRIHALEAENKGYEADLYELSDQVETQAQQLEKQKSDYEAQLIALTEAQALAQELAQQNHDSQLSELQVAQSMQQSEYETKLSALAAAQALAQQNYEGQLSELQVAQRAQQSDYERQLLALTEAQALAQQNHDSQLSELQVAQRAQQLEYEKKLAALAEMQAIHQEQISGDAAQIAALKEALVLAEQNHQSQLSEASQHADEAKTQLASYAEQQELTEAELIQQQQRLLVYTQGLRDIQEAYDQLVHQAQQSAAATTPLQADLEALQGRLAEIQQRDEQQQEAYGVTQEDLSDARAEQERKQKLLAQLENYGEESETLKSAREELLQEIAHNTQRVDSLSHTLTEIEVLQKSLAEELATLTSQVLQKQQRLQLLEQETRQRQEQAEQLQAFIDAFGQSEEGVAPAPKVNDDITRSLQAKVHALESEKSRLSDQIIVQEGELLKQSQELERLESRAHQEAQVALEQGSQPHLDQVISEEVAQISSLLSELNLGGEAEAYDDDDDLFSDAFPVLDLPEDVPAHATTQLPTVYVYTQKVEPTSDLRAQLADYLSQYRHQVSWIERSDQLQVSGAKGVIFLLTPEEKVDAVVLQHVKQAKIAHIEHVMSNITRLKIAVLDAFIG